MPTIPNYKLDDDDLNDLLLAKKKMLGKMKIEEKEIKYDGLKNIDTNLVISNFDSAEKLLRANVGLLKNIDNKISYPTLSAKGTRLSSLYKEIDITMVDIFDILDKFNYNLDLLKDTLTDLLPFTKFIDSKKFDKFYDIALSLHNNFYIFRNQKVEDPVHGELFEIVGNTRLKKEDFFDKFSISNDKFIKYTYIWEQFINQYKTQEKIPIK
jgi:hypothetical protein